MKKYILGLVFAVMAPITLAYASTPMLTVTGTGDNNNVTVQVTGGDINAPVVLFYNAIGGNVQSTNIGTTDVNGSFTGTVSTTGLGVNRVSPVYVQVGGFQSQSVNWPYNLSGATSAAGGLAFSPGFPSFSVGQNGTITITGGSGSYYISSNSNPNWTTASISGNTLTVSGTQNGSTGITVCSVSGPCGVINVNFGTAGTGSVTGSTSGSPTVSAGKVNVNMGGQTTVSVSGGTTPYSVAIPVGSTISTTLIGNTLYINGGSVTGTTVLSVCSSTGSYFSNNAACTPLTVNVQGASTVTTTTTTGSPLSFTLPLAYGQALQLSINGGSGSYYVQSSGTTPVMASVSGNTLTLSGSAPGSATINVCSTGTNTVTASCSPLSIVVNQASQPLTGTGGGFFFESDLKLGMSNEDVTELQQRLKDMGYFQGTVTGYFGPVTRAAVMQYQSSKGISATGYVGSLTRAAFNQ